MDFFTSSEYMEGRVASRGRPPLLWYFLFWAALVLAACTGGVAPSSDPAAQGSTYYTIGGTVTGLTGSGLTLQNNKGDNLSVTAAGTFSFETPLIRGNSYSVSVLTQPSTPTQTCAVSNGSGTVTGDTVTNVTVTCADKTATTDHIGGTVTGLAGSGLVLQNNGTDSLPVSSNGSFTFATALPVGMPYAVTVLTPPMDPFQNCSIVSGTGITTSADVNNIAVSCKTNSNPTYTVGGSISGIATSGPITLQNNGTDNLPLTADGMFTFATPIPSGSAYSVTALGSTTSKTRTCAFTNATGIVPAANVTNVIIKCAESTPIVNITVSVSGLTGSGLVLQNNGADDLTIAGNGASTFATGIASGSAYAVTILTQPSAQTCTVANGAGTASSNAVPVAVNCGPPSFTLSASVTGLAAGTQLTLDDTGAPPLVVIANGMSTFAIKIPYNGSYAVTVGSQPAGETCTVGNGTGAGVTANVTVTVNCNVPTYIVSAAVSGLSEGKQVTLLNNGADPLTVTANGTFKFATRVAYNGSYAVTIGTQPVGETCTVINGSGSGVAADVLVTVSCVPFYTVGGTVTGLFAQPLVLQLNGANPLQVLAQSASFVFPNNLADGTPYTVTILAQAPGYYCTLSNNAATISGANVTNVAVSCRPGNVTVSLFAGSTLGRFGPTNLVQDANNNIFVVDFSNNEIREIAADGTVSTIAGSPTAGSADGVGAAASFNGPTGIIRDSTDGSLFIADTGNNEIRQIVSTQNSEGTTWTVSTIAGSTAAGSADGRGAVARFHGPTGLVGGRGRLLVVDQKSNDIRLLLLDGSIWYVSTIAGSPKPGNSDGMGKAASFNLPTQIVNSSGISGVYYITDQHNNEIRALQDLEGIYSVYTIAGNGAPGYVDGTGDAAKFNQPSGLTSGAVCPPAGGCTDYIYVADTLNNSIRVVREDAATFLAGGFDTGIVTTLAGSSSGTAGFVDAAKPTLARFNEPLGITYCCGTDAVLVSDFLNQAIRQVDTTGEAPGNTTTLYSSFGSTDGTGTAARFYYPTGLAVDSSGNVYVADSYNNEIRKITPAGAVSTLAGSTTAGSADGTGASATFNNPSGIAVDQAGNVYVADSRNSKVRKITAAGVVTTLAGSGGQPFGRPLGIAVDGSGNVYVADVAYNEIFKITPAGAVSVFAGNTTAGSADGIGTSASFNGPEGIAIDTAGNLYIADASNNEIRKITPAGQVSTFAGTTAAGSADGAGADAAFNEPSRISIDGGGNLYISDFLNNEIREINSSGVVITLAGTASPGDVNGAGNYATFHGPTGIAVDSSGTVYVSDYYNNQIRKITVQ